MSIELRVSAILISSHYGIIRIWCGRDAAGRRAAGCVYFTMFGTGGVVQTRCHAVYFLARMDACEKNEVVQTENIDKKVKYG